MICTRLRSGHLSVRVGDGSRRSGEIVKKSQIAPFSAIIIIKVSKILQHLSEAHLQNPMAREDPK